jgi:Holliday junction resolvasome RuvABC endonuclease subunit
VTRKAKRPTDWSTVRWQDTTIVAFDPALANTGWACIQFHSYIPRPIIHSRGTFVTAPDDASNAGLTGSLERGDLIFRFARSLLDEMEPGAIVVYEAPINQSNAAHVAKIEGGPISAMAVRAAMVVNHYTPVTIEVQTWKKFVCGDGRADKEAVAATIGQIFPGLGRSNEHVRDAIGVAIGHMIKAERWSDAQG